jgi:hypothetical protein
MEAQPAPQGQPAPQAPPAKKSNTKKWLLGVGIGCLLVSIVCCVVPTGGFFIGTASKKSDAEAAIEDFVQAGRARDATRIYDSLDYYYQMGTDREGVATALPRCTGLVTNTSYTVEDLEVDHPFDDYMLARVRFDTPTGPVDANFGLSASGDVLKIGSYSENNPAQGYGYCDLHSRGSAYGY